MQYFGRHLKQINCSSLIDTKENFHDFSRSFKVQEITNFATVYLRHYHMVSKFCQKCRFLIQNLHISFGFHSFKSLLLNLLFFFRLEEPTHIVPQFLPFHRAEIYFYMKYVGAFKCIWFIFPQSIFTIVLCLKLGSCYVYTTNGTDLLKINYRMKRDTEQSNRPCAKVVLVILPRILFYC